MTRGVVVLAVALLLGACSSYNTGSGAGDDAERACLDTVEAFARAAERCGQDYKPSYAALLQQDASGDCTRVRAIRDETALRNTCLPFVKSQTCDDLANGITDPSCAAQLQRSL
jgi:predicted small secreted protein